MKKKIILMLFCLMATMGANAQFEKGKKYVGASLSGLNLSYNDMEKAHVGLQAKAGRMFSNNWMVAAFVDYDKQENASAQYSSGAGVRNYIIQNGLYLGVSASYLHCGDFL